MNREDELAGRIARVLDQGTASVDPAIVAQLRVGRERALDALRVETVLRPVPAGGPSMWHSGPLRYLNPRFVLPLLALLSAISGMIYWQYLQHIDELADVDANILSGDLPIDAYLDKGLDTWLKR
jgi:hypothetical protein